MRNTVFNGMVQYMVFQPGDKDYDTGLPIPDNLLGCPKGLKGVLQERGLWRANLRKQCGRIRKPAPGVEETEEEMLGRTLDQCSEGRNRCALRIMAQQLDFRTEESLLERVGFAHMCFLTRIGLYLHI